MEVVLKKTKITASILKQATRSTETDFNNSEVLGWCIFSKEKYIICYRSDINVLTKYLMFKDILVEPKYKDNVENKSYEIKVIFGGNYVSLTYIVRDETEKDNFVATFKKVKHQAEIRGQFYI